MAELKTRKNDASVIDFLNAVEHGQRREDALRALEIFREVTGFEPRMWGTSIVGFGSYHYKYASGQEGDWMMTGFSPRKQALTLYIMSGFEGVEGLMKKLGKYRTGKSCLYVKKLSDIDEGVLRELIVRSMEFCKTQHCGC